MPKLPGVNHLGAVRDGWFKNEYILATFGSIIHAFRCILSPFRCYLASFCHHCMVWSFVDHVW